MLTLLALAHAGTFVSDPIDQVTGQGSYRYGILVDGAGPLVVEAPVLPAWLTLSLDDRWTSTTLAGGDVPLFAGGPGQAGYADGSAADARFAGPLGVAVAPSGDRYIADTQNHAVRLQDPVTGEVTTVAGDGTPGHADGVLHTQLSAPAALDVAPEGRVWIADTGNHCIRRYDPVDGSLTTIAGTPGVPGADDGAAATFDRPSGIAVGPDGRVYVADTGNHTVRVIALDGTVSTLAGFAGDAAFVDGTDGRLSGPRGLQVHPTGLYVADTGNHAVRAVDPLTGAISTVAGLGTPGAVDGDAAVAQFDRPFDVAVDTSGTITVADAGNHRIRRVWGGLVDTLAGEAPRLLEGVGDRASFYFPGALAFEPDGALVIADTTNAVLRHLQPVDATLEGTATAAELGSHAVELTVTEAGDSTSQAFSIEVLELDATPTITGQPTLAVDEGQLFSFTPSASDADGDPLRFHVYALPTWASFDPLTGTVEGTPGFEDAGLWANVAITVDDGRGLDDSTATLRPFDVVVVDVNRAPQVVGTPPAATEGLPYSFTLGLVDPDGDPLTAEALGLPAWLGFDPATGVLAGTPSAADVGTVAFQIRVDDGRGTAVSVTTVDLELPVLALDLPPEASAPVPSLDLDAEQSGSVQIPADACVDPEGAAVTYRRVGPGWTTLSGLTLSARPPQAAHGRHFVELYGSDGGLESFCGTVVIEVTDRIGPTVELLAPESVDKLTRFSVQVTPSEPLAFLDTPDFVIEHGTAEQFVVHPAGQVLVVRPTGDGDVVITLPAGALEDVPGNPNPQTHSVTVAFVSPPPSPLLRPDEVGCGCSSGSRPVLSLLVLLLPLLRRRSLHP